MKFKNVNGALIPISHHSVQKKLGRAPRFRSSNPTESPPPVAPPEPQVDYKQLGDAVADAIGKVLAEQLKNIQPTVQVVHPSGVSGLQYSSPEDIFVGPDESLVDVGVDLGDISTGEGAAPLATETLVEDTATSETLSKLRKAGIGRRRRKKSE